MNAVAKLLDQRSTGEVTLRMNRDGIAVLREAGSSKCRIPGLAADAILMNTSGGLAGGDTVEIAAEAGAAARLTLTTQAAERVYRTLGPPARVSVRLRAEQDARLAWLPQETIFFDGSSLFRTLEVDLAEHATFIAVEPMVFGRLESGEAVRQLAVSDFWQVRRSGMLIHAEAFRMGPGWPSSAATLAGNRAAATLLVVAPDAERMIDAVRKALGPLDGASAWNGKLVARLVAADGHGLRKTLMRVLAICSGDGRLPSCWTF
jgi:urease accessory protein